MNNSLKLETEGKRKPIKYQILFIIKEQESIYENALQFHSPETFKKVFYHKYVFQFLQGNLSFQGVSFENYCQSGWKHLPT